MARGLRIAFAPAPSYVLEALRGEFGYSGRDATLTYTPATPALTFTADDAGTVNVAAAGSIQNTSSVSASWSITPPANLTVTPSSGTLAAGQTQALAITASAVGSYSLTLVSSGTTITGSPQTFVASSAAATVATLSGSTSGTTNSPTTFTVTLNGPVPIGGGTVSISAPDATLSTSTLTFTFGGSTSQTFTVTRTSDGTSSVSITNSMGLTNSGTPISHSTSAVGVIVTNQITSSAGGSAGWAHGQAFRQGDLPSGVSLAGLQTSVLSKWPDDSARVAIVAGQSVFSAGVAADVALQPGTAASGATLTTSDLQARMSDPVTTTAGAFGSANWSGSDWLSPFSEVCSGPVMSSWVYRKPIGSDAHLVAWLEVRLWAGGAVEVLPWIENGYLTVASPTNKSATYTFSLGGTERFSAAIDLLNHQRTPLVSGSILSHWLGTDPGVVVKHDAAYLQATKMVPSYSATVAAGASVVTSLPSTYTPLQQGSFPVGMGAAGYHGSIGPLPEWDVLYLTCHASDTAAVWAGLQRNAYSAGRYGIHFRDQSTNRPIRFTDHPTLVLGSGSGVGGVGVSSVGNTTPAATGGTPPTYNSTHAPLMGAMAYMLTGRWYHLETLQFEAAINYLKNSNAGRENSSGIFLTTAGANTTRGVGWAWRTLMYAAALTPDADTIKASLVSSYAANVDWYHTRYVVTSNNPQGWVQPYSDYTVQVTSTTLSGSTSTEIQFPVVDIYTTDDHYNGQELVIGGQVRTITDYVGATRTATVSPAFTVPTASVPFTVREGNEIFEATWMQDFVTYAMCHGALLGLSSSADQQAKEMQLAHWKARSIVGRFGGASTAQYLFRDAATYVIAVAPDNNSDFVTGAGPWYANWGELYDATFAYNGSPGTREDGGLRGGNFPDATSYWGNLMPALAMAVDVGAEGAASAWNRMVSASNWSTLAANFNTTPVWAAKPLTSQAVPAWLSSAAVNEWVSISGTALSSVQPTAPTAVAPSNPASKIDAWCGAALRRSDGTYIIGMAGGHADYAGNEIDTLRLSADAPAWVEASPRTADAFLYNRTPFNADLTGSCTHTYHYSQFLESLGAFVVFNNSGTDYNPASAVPAIPPVDWPYQSPSGAGSGSYAEFRWSPALKLNSAANAVTWQSPTYVPEFPVSGAGSGDWTAALCVRHPVTDDVYIARTGDRWRRFNAATRTWSNVSAMWETNYCGAAIDPTRNRMLIVGGFGSTVGPRVRDLSGNSISVTFGGLGAAALTNGDMTYAGVVYEERNDRFLVVRNSEPISVYAVDASTWEVSLLTTTGTAPVKRTNGIHNSAQYVPNLGGRSGIVIATKYGSNVAFLRTA